jgi:hypothetical protein
MKISANDDDALHLRRQTSAAELVGGSASERRKTPHEQYQNLRRLSAQRPLKERLEKGRGSKTSIWRKYAPTPPIVVRALARYRDHRLTIKAIAEASDVSASTLSNWAKRAGVPLRGRGRWVNLTPCPRTAHMVALAQFDSQANVARRLGVSRQAVNGAVRRWATWLP